MEEILMRSLIRLTRTIGAIFLLVVAAGCAAPSSDVQPQVSTENPDRLVCHETKTLGSNLNRRVCKTAREWQQRTEEDQAWKKNAERGISPVDEQPTAPGG